MRDYRGVSYDRIEDLKSREAISTIDEFLRQLSFGIGNLNNGKRADSSGRPTTPVALDDYFYLPGRAGGQLGHGGNAASDPLTLASTRHATKGSIYLGTAQQTAFDELNNRFGVGAPIPEVGLHINKQPAEALSLAASSDIAQVGDGWSNNTTSGFAALSVSPTLGTSDDTDTLYGGGPPATTRNYHGGLDGTVAAATDSWTITYVARRSGDMIGTVQFRVTRSDGTSALSAAIDLTTFTLTYATYTAVVSSGWTTGSGAAFTPNSFSATIAHQNGTPYLSISYLRITPTAGGGLASSVTLFERPAISTAPYSIWRDESDITVASITSTGAGKFQNVLLEDPGAGTGTISLIAPTAVSSYSLTLPANDGNNLDLLQTNGSGTLSWVTLASLLDDDLDAIGALTGTGVPYRTADNTWALAAGTSGAVLAWTSATTLVSSAALTANGLVMGGGAGVVPSAIAAGTTGQALTATTGAAPAWATSPTWVGLHTWTRASDATALLINSFSNAGTNPLLSILDASAVRIFGIDPSGTVSCGADASAVLDKVRFQVRAPASQSANIAQILLGGVSRWTIGATGKMVCTTTAPQFDTDAADAGDLWVASDADGNGDWGSAASIIDTARTWTTLQKFPDDMFNVVGSADATKIMRFEVDGLSIGTRTLTPQDANYTIAGTTVALGGTGLAAGTSGGVLGFTGATTLASSVLLTASALVLGGGAGATPTPMASLGTTTTLLHGNAAGAPTFGAVSLTADVSGDLPFANLAQGSARSVLGVTGNVTNDLASIQGSADQTLRINAAGTALEFGTLAVGGGGTGATSFTAGALLFGQGTSQIDEDPTLLFWDDSNNRLGVGTNAPRSPLDVVSGTALTAGGDTVGAAAITGAYANPASSTIGTLTLLSNTAQAAEVGPNLAFGARYVDANTTHADFAQILGAKENATSGNLAGFLAFHTRSAGGGIVAERMRLNSSGRLGLNTATPLSPLHIISTSAGGGGYPTYRGMVILEEAPSSSDPALFAGGIEWHTSDFNGGYGTRLASWIRTGLASYFLFQGRIQSAAWTTLLSLSDQRNVGINTIDWGSSAVGVLGIANGTAPGSSPADMVQLYSTDDGGGVARFHVRDEAGVITSLSPHSFARIPEGASEPMAWSHYSEHDGTYITADMAKVIRIVERLSGQKLIHTGRIG